MSDNTEPDQSALNVVQDAELLLESVREMRHLSTSGAATRAVHELLGNLSKAGHILPDAFTELANHLDPSVTLEGESTQDREHAEAQIERARALMEEAGQHALRAGINLREAQQALEELH